MFDDRPTELATNLNTNIKAEEEEILVFSNKLVQDETEENKEYSLPKSILINDSSSVFNNNLDQEDERI